MVDAFAFDAGPLSNFARTGRLDTLRAICGDARCFVTDDVRQELQRGADAYPSLLLALNADWLESVNLGMLEEITAFAEYTRVLGSTRDRDVGEASTLAWAEAHKAVAIVDDQAAANAARQRHVEAHGTLWLVVRGLKAGALNEDEAVHLVSAFLDANARFPFSSANAFLPWARSEGLLD